jgi:hypothetical protein
MQVHTDFFANLFCIPRSAPATSLVHQWRATIMATLVPLVKKITENSKTGTAGYIYRLAPSSYEDLIYFIQMKA